MWQMIDSGLRQHFRQHPRVRENLPALTRIRRGGPYDPGRRRVCAARLPETLISNYPIHLEEFYARHHPPAGKSVNWPAWRWPEAYRQPAGRAS